MLRLNKVGFKFPNVEDGSYDNEPYAIRDINLTINKREYVVITGEVGSGKSTLLRVLSDSLKPVGHLEGEINIKGRTSLKCTLTDNALAFLDFHIHTAVADFMKEHFSQFLAPGKAVLRYLRNAIRYFYIADAAAFKTTLAQALCLL